MSDRVTDPIERIVAEALASLKGGVADRGMTRAYINELIATDEDAFRIGDRVRKIKGSSWQGRIVGFYSTELTRLGCCVESEREPGSVQIYPQSALEPTPHASASPPPADDAGVARENEKLRSDIKRLVDGGDGEPAGVCEGCGAPLLLGDDFVTDPDGVAGCWSSMTDLPSKRERPCYSYRVGKPSAALSAKE